MARQKRSTTIAIALAIENIVSAKANNHYVNIVLRNVSKAFDKVWEGLKYKIKNLDLSPFMYKILCDYITDRFARL